VSRQGINTINTRRTFIKYLAASPLYAGLPGFRSFSAATSLQDVDRANELRLALVGVGARNLHEITRASFVRPA
jgi:hypothetical protein